MCALTELKTDVNIFGHRLSPPAPKPRKCWCVCLRGGGYFSEILHGEVCAGAFFDMYIGEVPVSEQTKEEIGKNVAMIIGKC